MAMIVNGKQLIAQQLKITEPTEMAFKDGSKTVLRPARYVPVPDGDDRRVSLDGQWRVTRWPFPEPESAIIRTGGSKTKWDVVAQPGKVFYDDPQRVPTTIPKWDRVTLEHIHPKDGAILVREVIVQGLDLRRLAAAIRTFKGNEAAHVGLANPDRSVLGDMALCRCCAR